MQIRFLSLLDRLVFFVVVCFIPVFAHASSQLPVSIVSEHQTSLDCYTIVGRTEQFCILATPSPLHPVDDVVFFRRDEMGQLTLLRAELGDIALVWIHGFSTDGKYTVIGYAEEGHPSYLVYDTQKVLTPGFTLNPVAVVSDYQIVNLHRLDGDGRATVEYGNGAPCEEAPKTSCEQIINIFREDSESGAN